MNTAVLFITLFACMAIGIPVAISLGLSSLLTIFFFSQDSLGKLMGFLNRESYLILGLLLVTVNRAPDCQLFIYTSRKWIYK